MDWAGFTRLNLPVTVNMGDEEVKLLASFRALVDLPRTMRGIHASRTYQAMMEASRLPGGLHEICCRACRLLLEKHDYSNRSMVLAKASIPVKSTSPITGQESYSTVVLLGGARLDGETCEARLGVEVIGLTTCPSAQRSIREALRGDSRSPAPTHTQRARVRITVQVPEGMMVDPLELARIAWNVTSSPVYGGLKKSDELRLLLDALSRPRLAEDVVREAARNVAEDLGLPGWARIKVRYESLESVHEQDFIAEMNVTAEEARGNLDNS